MLPDIVGREADLDAIDAFVQAMLVGLACLVLEGEPGIGKTTLWREAVRRAGGLGIRVLSSWPASTETRLSFAGLGDLLAQVPAEAVAGLPDPQRRALDVALLRTEARGPPPDDRAVSIAFLSVLRAQTGFGPVLVAVDDAQWLDAPTAGVLEFAARRLEGEPAGILSTLRLTDEPSRSFDQAVAEDRRRVVRLGPLSLAALHEIIKARLGHALPRPTLVRIEEASRGNPFHALEIAREVLRRGPEWAGVSLPVPDDVRILLAARIRRLPTATRGALLAAAALSEPNVELVDETALAPAEEAEIVRIEPEGAITFQHPLFASVVYESAPRRRRLDLHRSMAGLVKDPEERARHLALASEGPDEVVARRLGEAAERALARGAPSAAAELMELSVGLTPRGDPETLIRRRTRQADYLNSAGDTHRARELLERAIEGAPPGLRRAEALLLLGVLLEETLPRREGRQAAIDAFERALDEAEGERALMGRIHGQLAQSLDFDLPRAVAHARAATDLLTEADDGIVYANALQVLAAVELLAGHPPNEAAMEEAFQIERRGRGVRFGFDFGFFSVFWPLYHDDFETARSRFREVLDAAAAFGEDSVRPNMLGHLAETECQAGRFGEALQHAAESVEIAEQIGQHALAHFAEYAQALVDARVGNLQVAIAKLEWLERQVDPTVDQRGLAFFWSLRGFVALSAGDLPEADRWMTATDDLLREMGVREPARYRFHADHVEVVVALGQLDRARAMLERMEERARTFPRPWILAMAARCEGLLLAARRDLVGAERELERALVEHERLEMPFELGRTLLVLGQVQRRRKQGRAARESLARALRVFESLGARIWTERARAELERTHVREAPEEMSPSERRVAELAATGLTNRAIADRLFLSPKTVEANLARVYRKLGIRSRAELGARMAGHP